MNILNLSGGGSGAMSFQLAAIERLEDAKGIKFDQAFGVSGGCVAAVGWASVGAEETIRLLYRMPDAYDPDWKTWIKYAFGFSDVPRNLGTFAPMLKFFTKELKDLALQKPVTIQMYDWLINEPYFLQYEKGDSAVKAMESAILAMSIPGLMGLWESKSFLRCDIGAMENAIATERMPKDATIYVISVHGRESAVMTRDKYNQSSFIDLVGEVISSMSYVMYRDDVRKLKQNYPYLKFYESPKKLPVFDFSMEAIEEGVGCGFKSVK